jgi:outer membrane protein OmpU
MKKILFATTALIATAGMAAAEVRLSGYGRFGLDYI